MNRQLFRYHPIIGHTFVPGIKARVEHESGGYLLRTNRAGFRCKHEFVAKKSPGVRRVLLFGDSYTAGDGVSDRYRYGDLLESMIPGLEVYNFGLSGSGTDQQYLIWNEFAREMEHDLVIIGVLVENIRRIVAQYRMYESSDGKPILLAKPHFTLAGPDDLRLHNVPVPKEPLSEQDVQRSGGSIDRGGRFSTVRRWVSSLGPQMKERIQRWTRYQPLPAYNRANDPDWVLMRSILERWQAEIPGPVVICPIPLYQYVEETASPDAYQSRFRELESLPRVRVHDPLSDFQQVSRMERRAYRFEVDCHLTPAAHEVLARSLANCIAPMLSLKMN